MLPIKIESFEGPLDLLLKLIEQEQLDITEVSLATVTGEYLKKLDELSRERQSEEIADFLVVAAKLVLIKSRLLLPQVSTEEEEEIADFTRQLRIYQEFVRGAKLLEKVYLQKRIAIARPYVPPVREVTFSPPPGITPAHLATAFRGVVTAIQLPVRIPKRIIFEARVTLHERIKKLRELVVSQMRVSFHETLSDSQNRADIVVTFLALLELVKQQIIEATQDELFSDITLSAVTYSKEAAI